MKKKIIPLLILAIILVISLVACKAESYLVFHDGNFIINPNEENYLKNTKIDFKVDANKVPKGQQIDQVFINEKAVEYSYQGEFIVTGDTYIRVTFKDIPPDRTRVTFEIPENVDIFPIEYDSIYYVNSDLVNSTITITAPKYYKLGKIKLNDVEIEVNDVSLEVEVSSNLVITILEENLIKTHYQININKPENVNIINLDEEELKAFFEEGYLLIGQKLVFEAPQGYRIAKASDDDEIYNFETTNQCVFEYTPTKDNTIKIKPEDIIPIIIEVQLGEGLMFNDGSNHSFYQYLDEIKIYTTTFNDIGLVYVKYDDQDLIEIEVDGPIFTYRLLGDASITATFISNQDVITLLTNTATNHVFANDATIEVVSPNQGFKIVEFVMDDTLKQSLTFQMANTYYIRVTERVDSNFVTNLYEYKVDYQIDNYYLHSIGQLAVSDFINISKTNLINQVGLNNDYYPNINFYCSIVNIIDNKEVIHYQELNDLEIKITKIELYQDGKLVENPSSYFEIIDDRAIKFKEEAVNKNFELKYFINDEYNLKEKVSVKPGFNAHNFEELKQLFSDTSIVRIYLHNDIVALPSDSQIISSDPQIPATLVNEIDLSKSITGNVFFRHIDSPEARSLFLYGNFFTIDVSAYNKLNQNNQTEPYSAVFAVLNNQGLNQTTNIYNLKIIGSQKVVLEDKLVDLIVGIYAVNAVVNLDNVVIEKLSRVAIYIGIAPEFKDIVTSAIYYQELAKEIEALD